MGKMGLSLVNLCDVEVDTPTDQYLLYWDESASKWKCKALGNSDIPSGLVARASAGEYTGNNNANRAVPHGLGATPKIVFIIDITWENCWFRILGGYNRIHVFNDAPFIDSLAVTQPDNTNFYVGTAGDMGNSANFDEAVYDWVAIG